MAACLTSAAQPRNRDGTLCHAGGCHHDFITPRGAANWPWSPGNVAIADGAFRAGEQGKFESETQ